MLETFKGPAGLSTFLVDNEQERLSQCLVTQYLRFASGRSLGTEDAALVDAVNQQFAGSGLLSGFCSSPTGSRT